jgi:hypothetical protein
MDSSRDTGLRPRCRVRSIALILLIVVFVLLLMGLGGRMGFVFRLMSAPFMLLIPIGIMVMGRMIRIGFLLCLCFL